MEAQPILVVATWGDPTRWSAVNYELDSGRIVKANCTLLPLLLKAGRGAKALVVVPDTLYAAFCRSSGCGAHKEWEGLEAEVRGRVEQHYRGFLESCEVGGQPCSAESWLESAASVVVCPGVGRFELKGRWLVFKGSLQLYTFSVLLHVLGAALEGGGVREIWLDVSHGVNYMPSAALTAVLSAARILRFKPGGVKVRVFNSDPFLLGQQREGGAVLAIHEMEMPLGFYQLPLPDAACSAREGEKLVDAVLKLLSQPQTLLAESFRGSSAENLRKLGGRLSEVEQVVESFWYAASYGLPLIVLDYAPRKLEGRGLPSLKEVVDTLTGALYEALGGVPLQEKEGSIVVDTASLIDQRKWQLLEVLLEVYAVTENLLEVSKSYEPEEREGRKGYRLSKVSDLVEKHLARTAPQSKHFFSVEESGLLRCLSAAENSGKLGQWHVFEDLMKSTAECRGASEHRSDILDDEEQRRNARERVVIRYRDGFQPRYGERNFIAHSGLTYRDVEVFFEPDERSPGKL
ncbi:MAG: TM1812 family CRISPR-associated protein [Thermofilum sp.]